MKIFIKLKPILVSCIIAALFVTSAVAGNERKKSKRRVQKGYEIYAADQSNSIAGVEARGIEGSWIWVWDSKDVKRQLRKGKKAQPLGCDGKNRAGEGPCNILDVFPGTLKEFDADGSTGHKLIEFSYGRLHGMLVDPQNRYLNVNLFGPGQGFVGILDGRTKEAIALFRVTGTSAGRSLHMSFWNSDGSAILLANLNGKVLERIDVKRDRWGNIIQAAFNRSASLGVGQGMSIVDGAKVYRGKNAQGRQMIGSVTGDYTKADFGDLTPSGKCRENGCAGSDGDAGGRPNNVIVCPIVSDTDKAYITFGGGGLLVADTSATPMTIVGEYGNQVVNGAGCGGVQVGDYMWLNAGASAGAAGATQSTFTMYTIDDTGFDGPQPENTPNPTEVFKDPTNTATIGNLSGPADNQTGQIPGITTRRDAHGMARTLSGRYIHNVDRLQNNVEVFNTKTLRRTTYDLTSRNGKGRGLGACAKASVEDYEGSNDPAPDLIEPTPDGKFLVVALRGPVPVSVAHNAQGSCPGVGIIKLTKGGSSGRLVGVLRTTNTVDTAPQSAPGGIDYPGVEHSDPHGASVRQKQSGKRRLIRIPQENTDR